MLQKSGNISYNGHNVDEFCVQRTCGYISQSDNLLADLTVRETLDFAARCQASTEPFAGFSIFIFFLISFHIIWIIYIYKLTL